MAKYSQITQGERYQIWVFRKAGKSNGEIARELGRHPSTIGREIRRNRGERGYRPKQAHQAARERCKQAARAVKFTTEVRLLVEERLEWEWSPEQIASRLKHEQGIEISHERIYQYVLEDKRNGGLLYRHLRRGRRRRKKRYGVPAWTDSGSGWDRETSQGGQRTPAAGRLGGRHDARKRTKRFGYAGRSQESLQSVGPGPQVHGGASQCSH